MRKYLKWAGVTAIFVAILYGGWVFTISNGHKAMKEIAKEKGFCTDEICEEGTAEIERLIAETTNMSPRLIEWCVGVDDWAAAKVHRGGFIKSILVDVMYWPCESLRSA